MPAHSRGAVLFISRFSGICSANLHTKAAQVTNMAVHIALRTGGCNIDVPALLGGTEQVV